MKKIFVALVVCLFAFTALEVRAQQPAVPELTSSAYASMKKDDVYVVMFTMHGCGPCIKAKKTFLPMLAQKYASEDNVHVYLFPVDEDVAAPDGTYLYTQLGVNQAPTFVVLYNGASMFSRSGFSAAISDQLERDITAVVNRVK